MTTNEKIAYHRDFEKWIQKIKNITPLNPSGWHEATDEIRDVCKDLREFYNEIVVDALPGEPDYEEGLNFRQLRTPALWNREALKFIDKLVDEFSVSEKAQFFRSYILPHRNL